MTFSNLQALFLSKEYKLPYLEANDTRSFLHRYHLKMEKYLRRLGLLPQEAFDTADKNDLIIEIGLLVQSIEEVLLLYLSGHPAEAYMRFKELVESEDLIADLNFQRISVLKRDSTFFRIKKEHENKPAWSAIANGFNGIREAIDLFHVPFEKRKAIGTNRFSIPGFPCIYLSDSLNTSWSECLEKSDERFHAICFKNHRPLYLVDLVPLNFETHKLAPAAAPDKISKSPILTLVNYACIYPLICACHSKIKYVTAYPGEVQFKSEYIVPQLLLQWYRENKVMVDGIKYLSCTAELKFPRRKFSKFNYVLPVTSSQETGFCDALVKNFSSSRVFSYLNPVSADLPAFFKQLNKIEAAMAIEPVSPLKT